MDHRDSFGKTLFGVVDDRPDSTQLAAMTAAKELIFAGLRDAMTRLPYGRAGVLVDEQYGQAVIDDFRAERDHATLAVPVEASGHEWFTLQWGDEWLRHVRAVGPDYAKVLVRDNPEFDKADRDEQFARLAAVSSALTDIGVPLLYELLVPATDEQLASVGHDARRYDHDIRPGLVGRVIADNQEHGIEPSIWKVEGLETVDACTHVAEQATAAGRTADLIVLGRDAPEERLDHWLDIASRVPAFVGFAIGRSIWEDVVRDYQASAKDDDARGIARSRIADRYLGFVGQWNRSDPPA
jgi:myo-inositol catabolism protein IolC